MNVSASGSATVDVSSSVDELNFGIDTTPEPITNNNFAYTACNKAKDCQASVLTVPNAKASDSGFYTCVISGEEENINAKLTSILTVREAASA